MAEVVDWSPVDESNNSPPPVGAPEHHAPSATNNIMRAMMGSIRRWYDSVNTQLASYLPLTGGTVTGDVGFTGPRGIHVQGTWLDGDGAGNLVVRNVASGDAAGAVISTGYGAGFLYSDRDMTSLPWSWWASAGNTMLGRYGAAPIITVNWGGLVTISGDLMATGTVNAAGQITGAYIYSSGDIASGGNIGASGHVTASGNIDAAGTVEGAGVHSTGDILADANIGAYGAINAGSFSAVGAVTAASVSASGAIAGNTVNASGAIVGNTVNANAISSNGPLSAQNIVANGTLNVASDFTASGPSTLSDVHLVGKISAIGNDTNFYIQRNGTQRIINFEPNTYIGFDTATNTLSIVIDGVTKAAWGT